MTETAQGCFDTADEDGNIFVGLSDQITVDHGGIIRTFAHLAARGKGVCFPLVLGDGIVVDHGVHVATGHQKSQAGTAVDVDGLGILPVRLGDDAHRVAVALQNTADDGVAKGMVIHIGITNDIDKVTLVPATVDHILFTYGEKAHNEPPKGFLSV